MLEGIDGAQGDADGGRRLDGGRGLEARSTAGVCGALLGSPAGVLGRSQYSRSHAPGPPAALHWYWLEQESGRCYFEVIHQVISIKAHERALSTSDTIWAICLLYMLWTSADRLMEGTVAQLLLPLSRDTYDCTLPTSLGFRAGQNPKA